jgi:uncharacterized protein (DUF2235 family)
MDIRAIVFNSQTYNRDELEKKNDQELFDLYMESVEREDAQVQLYFLDEFSTAYNEGYVSDEDFLFFIDIDDGEED